MTKTLQLLAAVSMIALTSTAFAQDNKTTYKEKDNGGYKVESKSELTTNAGTDKAGSHKVDVDISDDGSVSKTVKSKSTTDAEGLMNGRGVVKTSETEKNADGTAKVKNTKESYNSAGTNTKTEQETEVKYDANGNKKTIVETTKTVDPKGLLNKSETTTRTVNGKVVHD